MHPARIVTPQRVADTSAVRPFNCTEPISTTNSKQSLYNSIRRLQTCKYSLRQGNFFCYYLWSLTRIKSYNWPYRAMVKILFKKSWVQIVIRSIKIECFSLLARHTTPQQKLIGICRQPLELSSKYAALPLSHNGRNSFKKFIHLDDFQIILATSLSQDKSMVKIFTKIKDQ